MWEDMGLHIPSMQQPHHSQGSALPAHEGAPQHRDDTPGDEHSPAETRVEMWDTAPASAGISLRRVPCCSSSCAVTHNAWSEAWLPPHGMCPHYTATRADSVATGATLSTPGVTLTPRLRCCSIMRSPAPGGQGAQNGVGGGHLPKLPQAQRWGHSAQRVPKGHPSLSTKSLWPPASPTQTLGLWGPSSMGPPSLPVTPAGTSLAHGTSPDKMSTSLKPQHIPDVWTHP